ncbi:phytanoyl- dioxygenase family protein [Phlyctema vagabunda]|uniref:Phytanoyl- dioxygenase family protein n=1 Tax=Phlyctema vagabunda TaxID=108571 RepID=A0ABR4PD44_9HELO
MQTSLVEQNAADSVRRYTEQLAAQQASSGSGSMIERFLVQDHENEMRIKKEKDSWRKYYEPWNPSDINNDPITAVLQTEARNLSRSWLKFRRSLPEDQRDDIEGQVPSVEGLIQMVTRYTSSREEEKAKSKRGRFMKHFSSVCSTIQSHQVMLDVLPSGSEYVSILTGALKTIVTACSNYDRISQGLAEALSKIGKHIAACVKEASLFRTADMQLLLAKLYAHIFLFLEDVMKWYLKKSGSRFLDAFRGDFYDEFKEQIEGILQMSLSIKREADVGSKAEIRSIRFRADDINDQLFRVTAELNDLRLGMEGSSRDLAEVRQMMKFTSQADERYRQSQIQSKEELPDRVNYMTEILSQIFATANAKSLLNSRGRVFHEQQALARPQAGTLLRDDIEYVSRHLEDYFDRSKFDLKNESDDAISLDSTIAARVQEWTAASESGILSLAGYVVYWPEVSQTALLSSMCMHSATKASLPVLSYFCELKRGQVIRQGNTRQSQELVALLGALVRQMLTLIPPQVRGGANLSPTKFEALDGTMHTWSILLDLFRGLLIFSPPRLYIIIDGFQWLDDTSTNIALRELVNVLRGADLTDEHGLKVLITTQGRSACLEKELSRDELIYADHQRAGSGASRRRGGMPFTASIT